MKADKTRLSERLLRLRKQNGLTQMELAERLNISRQAISRWEVGLAVPSTENLKMLSELYGVRIDYLLVDEKSDASDVSEVYSSSCEHTHNRKWNIPLIACVLLIALAVTALVYMGITQNQEQDQIVPIENMSVETDDNSIGTFVIE